MAKEFILKKGKHIVSKAYTLLEMVIVLSVVSILFLCLSMYRFDSILLLKNMEKMKVFMVSEKCNAILNKQKVHILIDKNNVNSTNNVLQLDKNMYCENYEIVMNEKGNVNKGGSFVCSYNKKSAKFIIHLGNGEFTIEK